MSVDGQPAVDELFQLLSLEGALGKARSTKAVAGGVSGRVFRVTTDGGDVIVKQPLEYLAVDAHWQVPRRRVLAEAAGLRAAAAVVPKHVPKVLAVNPTDFVLGMESVPATAVQWRQLLLAGRSSTAIARSAGEILAVLHRGTQDLADPLLTQKDLFEALRVQPFLRASAAERPQYASALSVVIDELDRTSRCLVHGDYTPKNILVDEASRPASTWVVDFEVSHRGDPRFDVCLLVVHLLLEARAPGPTGGELALAVLDAYELADGLAEPDSIGSRLLGALLLARLVGWSPSGDIDPQHVDTLEAFAGHLLNTDAGLQEGIGLWPKL